MEITRLKVNIEDVYISKPLERETFIKVTNEHPSTIHSLYLIANELKAMHYFLELMTIQSMLLARILMFIMDIVIKLDNKSALLNPWKINLKSDLL